jgi:hypothetical protein
MVVNWTYWPLDFSAYPALHRVLKYAVSPAISIEHILSMVEKAVRVLLVEASEEDKLSGSSNVLPGQGTVTLVIKGTCSEPCEQMLTSLPSWMMRKTQWWCSVLPITIRRLVPS